MTASAFGGFLYFRELQRLSAGVAQIAFSSILVWGTLLSVVVLGSEFSITQIVGAVLLMGAIWLSQHEPGQRFNRGVLFILASAACFAGFQVASADVADSLTPGTYVLLAYLGPALLTFLALARPITGDFRALKGRRWMAVRSALPAAVTSVSYYVFAFFAYRDAPDAGVVVLLLTSQVIVALVLAMVFLGERRHPRRTLAAAALAVVAGVAIKA